MSKVPDRLLEQDRKCDGCGVRIGRWTEQCFYDERLNRVYCSTGGCAETVREAGSCAGCGTPLNPFEEQIITNPLNRLEVKCVDCGVPKKGTPVKKVEGTSKSDLEWVNAGPYVVEEGLTPISRELIFRIRLGVGGEVRGTAFDKVEAYKRCAKFNRGAA